MVFSISSESDRLERLKLQLGEHRQRINKLEGQRSVLQGSKTSLEEELQQMDERMDDLRIIEAYLSKFADERQAQVYRQIETTVTEGLRAVFNEDMRLEISTKMVGSRTEAVFTLISYTDAGELRTSIMDARGGGVAAIVGFLTQAVMVLLTPKLRPIVFLDEAFRNVSNEYQEPLGQFIKDLCERTGLQVVLITHQPTITEYADKCYTFSQRNGETTIKEVK